MRTVEVLAPAGNKESLIGAINSGANAVYLGGRRFGARAFAHNFDDEQLIEAITYAHLRGVLVYVTVNTVVYDDEMKAFLDYTDLLARNHVDALIVQDLGVIALLTKRYPTIAIHASTQVNTHNIEQVRFLKGLGVSRIVLARETAIDTIRKIKKEVEIEIEVFVHGALCISYSGNCLMSSMQGGRSGNRGECAQPCRLPYALYKDHQKITDESYLLSAKDLMTLAHVNTLIAAGVDSFKIEGRMRKPEYVIQSVLSYQKAINATLTNSSFDLAIETDRLMRVFNRAFTKGYLLDARPEDIVSDFRPNHQGVEVGKVIHATSTKCRILLSDTLRVNDGYRIINQNNDEGNIVSRIITDQGLVRKADAKDVITLDVTKKMDIGALVLKTADVELEKSLEIYLDEHYKLIAIKGFVTIRSDQMIRFVISDGLREVAVNSRQTTPKALKVVSTKEQVLNQLSKLGNTPFFFETLDIDMDDDVFVPVKVLNELRREAIDALTKLRMKREEVVIDSHMIPAVPMAEQQIELIIKVSTPAQFEAARTIGISTVYYEDILKADEIPESWIPVKKRIQMQKMRPLDRVSVINDVGQFQINFQATSLIANQYLNITNVHAAALMSRHNVIAVTLSPEMSLDRIRVFYDEYQRMFNQNVNLEMVVYGRVDLMISRYCPIAKTFKTRTNCHLCEKNQYALEDRFGVKFPLVNDGNCNIRILNHRALNLMEYVSDLIKANVRRLRLDFTTESVVEMKEVIRDFQKAMKGQPVLLPKNQFTYGRFLK